MPRAGQGGFGGGHSSGGGHSMGHSSGGHHIGGGAPRGGFEGGFGKPHHGSFGGGSGESHHHGGFGGGVPHHDDFHKHHHGGFHPRHPVPFGLMFDIALDLAMYDRLYRILRDIEIGRPVRPEDYDLMSRCFGRYIEPYEVRDMLRWLDGERRYM